MPDGESRGGDAPAPPLITQALEIDIVEESETWRGALKDLDGLIERAVAQALTQAGERVPRAAMLELCVVLADDAFVHDLNKRYRGKDRPTNVLSFPSGLALLEDCEARALGDLALAFETVAAEAQARDVTLAAHLAHLVVHGTLHLVGYTHDEDADGDVMVAAERAALAALGFGDPYAAQEDAA